MRLVIHQLEILVTEVENAVHVATDFHLWQRQGFSGQLQVRLVQVVHIQVRVTQRMHELAGLQDRSPGPSSG